MDELRVQHRRYGGQRGRRQETLRCLRGRWEARRWMNSSSAAWPSPVASWRAACRARAIAPSASRRRMTASAATALAPCHRLARRPGIRRHQGTSPRIAALALANYADKLAGKALLCRHRQRRQPRRHRRLHPLHPFGQRSRERIAASRPRASATTWSTIPPIIRSIPAGGRKASSFSCIPPPPPRSRTCRNNSVLT